MGNIESKGKRCGRRGSASVLGIDPGLTGAFVWFDGKTFTHDLMPLTDDGRVDFGGVRSMLDFTPTDHVFLERAVPMAMGSKHAFNYGRDFAALEIAIRLSGLAVTYVEPSKWTKEVYQGISNDLKPKAKSALAVGRLMPKLVPLIPVTPKSKKMHEGVVDALLIAWYGYNALMRF